MAVRWSKGQQQRLPGTAARRGADGLYLGSAARPLERRARAQITGGEGRGLGEALTTHREGERERVRRALVILKCEKSNTKDCRKFRFSIVRIVIGVLNVKS